MNNIFVFDVDGTLTPSRGKMDSDFEAQFIAMAKKHSMYLVTGSDKPKTIEQVGKKVYNSCKAVYQCSGNEKWIRNTLISSNEIEIPDDMRKAFDYWLRASQFIHRTGGHVDERNGLVNFSILGRGASPVQRAEYVEWDKITDERRVIAATLSNAFGDKYSIRVAGETGIDITYKGAGKQQIVQELIVCNPGHTIQFFGDRTEPGGNDHGIAQKLLELGHIVYTVKGWQDTQSLLLNQDI